MNEHTFLTALHENPADDVTWNALADWLADDGQADRAELLAHVRRLRSLPVSERTEERAALEERIVALLASGVRPVVPEVVNTIGMRLALIPPGRFVMGSPPDEPGRKKNEMAHLVEITRPFYMSVFPVTQGQYRMVMETSPGYFREGGLGDASLAEMNADLHPVEMVVWSEAEAFCQRLTKKESTYVLQLTYRLPTEAEWEYACRAGTYSRFHSGDDESALRRAGWYAVNTEEGTTAVGLLEPNAWGLYDMHGNVYEWCADRFRTFTPEDVTDPFGRDTTSHCIRGGYWGRPWLSCRSAFRDSYSRGARASIAGFRVVRDLDGVRGRRREEEE